MAAPAVTDYRAVWNIEKNFGSIAVKIQGKKKGFKLKIENAAEYLALLSLLQGEKTVFFKPPFLDTAP